MQDWKVYIIRCDDDSLYTGISTDVEKRFEQHLNKKGAKYFYARSPVEILYIEDGHDRSSATKRELEIKKLNKSAKQVLIKVSKT